MENFVYAKSIKELRVYQLAVELSREIFALSKKFPKEETYSLTDQIRRSSRSVGAQLAEGWGKRRYEKHFLMKLTDADAEHLETQHWIETAFDCGYLDQCLTTELINKYEMLGRMIGSMQEKSSLFCKHQSRSR